MGEKIQNINSGCRFGIESALDGNYLNAVLKETAQIDEIAMKMMKEDCPDFLLPLQQMIVNDRMILKYKLHDLAALSYSSLTLTKSKFIDFYIALLTPFEQVSDWFLDYHYICIDSNYVYLSRDMSKAFFVYVPERSYRNTEEEIIDFFKNILNQVTITDDGSILLKLYQYFSKNNVAFSQLRGLLEADKKTETEAVMLQPAKIPVRKAMLESEAAKSAAAQDSAVKNDVPEKKPIKNNMIGRKIAEKKAIEKNVIQKDIIGKENVQQDVMEQDVMEALFGKDTKKKQKKEKKKTEKPEKEKSEKKKSEKEKHFFGKGFFGKKKEMSIEKIMPDMENKEIQMQDDLQQVYEAVPEIAVENSQEQDVTELADAYIQSEAYLELTEAADRAAISRISLDFPGKYITIGRKSNDTLQPDIAFERSFKQISRMHLRIEKNGDMYYVIDLGSANHTFLNGQKLIPNVPYEMKDGMELSLAYKTPVRYRVIL